MLLVLSVLALGIGPLVYQWAKGRPRGLSFLDGFNVTAITYLVLLAVVPGAVRAGDWLLIGFGVVGFVGPSLAERFVGAGEGLLHRAALWLGALVLALHAVSDGVVLSEGGALLPGAVLLHQIPVGLSLWWLTRRHGPAMVAAVFGGMVAATVVGYSTGPALLRSLSQGGVQGFQAFVGGGLIHVIHHRIDPRHHCTESHAVDRRTEAVGALVALVTVTLFLVL